MTRARECGSKQRHTKKGAEDHIWGLVRAGARRSALQKYRCKHCGHWHVGHRKRRRR